MIFLRLDKKKMRQIKREKDEICQLTSVLKDNQEIEFLKDYDVINNYL